jgi:serine/threonine protein kinase/tetratricopeptide (TPR) repeat protein
MDTGHRLKEALAGRYRVERLLGEGGMALVYLAEDLKHHRSVAIKVLRPEVSAALGTERFLREIEIAAGLNHPNILPLHDSGGADGLLYFVMPFVEGESLRERLDRDSRLSLEEALRLTGEVGDALGYAHDHGLVHRDIKPENILIQAGHALVCDFGIARVTEGAAERLTQTGISVGTFTYMSPEQLSGDGEVDGRTDVYALGCLLHEMLSGKPPFQAPTPRASLARKLTGPVPKVTDIRPDVPHTVQEVLERALAVEVGERFPTATAFTGALEVATTTAAVERDTRRRQRRKQIRTAAGIAGVALLAGFTWWVATLGSGPSMDRIAVLPLVNERRDPTQDYYLQGVHRDLIVELSKAGLRVINETSVARFAETDRPLREIAEELDVDGIVQGRVSLGPDRVSVRLTLVDGETDEILWTESFAETLRNVVSLYRHATLGIAQEIGVRLSGEVQARLAEASEVDPQVYDALLQARFHWQTLTEDGLATAEDYYELALERDSLSAEAWTGIANVWLGRAQMGLVSSEEANRHAEPAMARAAEIDPSLEAVQAARARRLVWADWNFEAAVEPFIRALDADPTSSLSRAAYSQLLLYLNRDDEALEQAERAASLDPFNTLVQGLYAQDLNFLHRPEDAEAVLLRLQERDPEAPMVLSTLRTTYHLLGRYEEAMEMWRASYGALGDTEALAALEDGYATGGYNAALRAVADLFVERSDTTYVPPWQIATLYTRAGEGELAVEYLERALEDHDQNMPSIAIDPIFDFMRDDPRFQSLLERLGLPPSRMQP